MNISTGIPGNVLVNYLYKTAIFGLFFLVARDRSKKAPDSCSAAHPYDF